MVETVFQETSGGFQKHDQPGMLDESNPKPGWWTCEKLQGGGVRWAWRAPLNAWEPTMEDDDGK